jgi:hypothetical protein
VLKIIFGSKKREWREAGENCIQGIFMTSQHHIESRRMRWEGYEERMVR